jgi:choline dehydrogenase-like flavoprotein
MAERVDVCIVGSGFGGSIAAWRLAELYRAAGEDPGRIVVLERGRRFGHTDFRQSMDIEHLSAVYGLIQGQGAQIVVGNLVGGGSNLYLAASLRAPSETFERTDHHPSDGPARRMWPKRLSRKSLDRYYGRAEAALRVHQPGWNEVSKSGGLWAAALHDAGHSCDRVPVAIDAGRCVDAKWCHTGCIFGAKNSVITNYLGAAEGAGVEVRPLHQVDSVSLSNARPYRYKVRGVRVDPGTKQSAGSFTEIEAKVVILAAGAMGSPPILMRSRAQLPGLSPHIGKHLGVNGDHIAAAEFSRKRVRRVLGLDYDDFYKGKPITTMSYDWFAGRPGPNRDGTRFTLLEIFLSQLTNFLYDDGRGERNGDPSWWGREKKRSVSTWSRHIELLAMVEDTHDGEFFAVPPAGNGHVQPNGGPIGVGTFAYRFSPQSTRIREEANEAMRSIVERKGIGKLLELTETRGAYASHPLGGCRMADEISLGVTDHRCEVFGYEGLFCMDSSAIPTSLGVNPSLTISAVCERAAAALTLRAGDHGLPKRPVGFRHRRPPIRLGPRVQPARGA